MIEAFEYFFNSEKLTTLLTTLKICWMNCWMQYLKTNSIMLFLYDSPVEHSNCQNMVVFHRCFFFYILPPCSKPVVNQESNDDVIIWWHDVFFNIFEIILFGFSISDSGPSFVAMWFQVLEIWQLLYVRDLKKTLPSAHTHTHTHTYIHTHTHTRTHTHALTHTHTHTRTETQIRVDHKWLRNEFMNLLDFYHIFS